MASDIDTSAEAVERLELACQPLCANFVQSGMPSAPVQRKPKRSGAKRLPTSGIG